MSELWQSFSQNKLAIFGLITIIILILAAIFAPYITPASYEEQNYLYKINNLPSKEHWFGVDAVGRDYFSRVIYGIRISFLVGFVAALIALLIGVPLGAIAGYFRGSVDWFVMRFIEIFSVIPPVLIGILFAISFGTGIKNIILIIGLVSWMNICRLTRGEIISIKEKDYYFAAKVIGSNQFRILFRHLLPNAVSTIIVGLVLCVPRAIMLEAMLSFLGVGVNPPMPSWGQMINDGLYYMQIYWHLPLFPSIFLAITILSLSLVGDGIRDVLDPKMRVKIDLKSKK